MSTKDRFNQPMDFYTEEEWEKGDDSDTDWTPPVKIDIPWTKPTILKDK